MNRKAADYMIGENATIEDVENLDDREIYYQGEKLTEERLTELRDAEEREAVRRHMRTG